jgi:uncharacterized protein (UPF0305 family)
MDHQEFGRAFQSMVTWEPIKPPQCQFPGCTHVATTQGYGYGSVNLPSKMYVCDQHYQQARDFYKGD